MSARRCGTIGIAGRPNAGKSSLLNRIVGEKVSIVSAKPQTTRHLVTGILTRPDCQYVFVDAPGQQSSAKSTLHRRLNRRAAEAARRARPRYRRLPPPRPFSTARSSSCPRRANSRSSC